jgi:hypothetical protein
MKRAAAAMTEYAPLEAAPDRGTKDEFLAYCGRLSRQVLHERLLQVGPKQFRVVECEVYCRSPAWDDMFTHADPQQLVPNTLYFHKTGNGFRGGSYKGMDLGCGQATAYGGVLVRSLVDLETNEMTSGPSLCVDLILKVMICNSLSFCLSNKNKDAESGIDNRAGRSLRVGGRARGVSSHCRSRAKARCSDSLVAACWAESQGEKTL